MFLSVIVIWLIMGVIAILGDGYMARNHYGEQYRNRMNSNRSEVAAMMFVCMMLGIFIVLFQLLYIASAKIQKAYK